jgi:hypothetical protein
MAIDKSTWNKKVKVSQSTIDDIKRLGMTKALRLAKQNAGAEQSGLVKEYQEGTRRLYGDRRFAAATKVKSVAPKPTDSRFSGIKKADPKKPTDSRFSGVKKAAPKPKDSRFSGIKPNQSPVMPGKGPAAKVATQKTKPRFGGFSMVADAVTGKNSTTSASVAARRKAAASTVKRGGGRTA